MFFKKYKVKKTQENKKNIPYIIWIIGIFLVFFLWAQAITLTDSIEFHIKEISESKENIFKFNSVRENILDKKDILTTQEKINDSINILLLWRGWGNHDAPDLTDTIILASINLKKNVITLFSIPRDLYVEYPGSKKTWKVNKIYKTFKYLWEEEAIKKLEEKISEITNQRIDYYVNVDFKWFKKIIDIVGGVEVTLEKNFVDEKYPDDNLWYTTFILRKWTWTLDGEVALKYARSRHSTSDFDRSMRQQEILSSLKNKILGLWYFTDTQKLRKLYLAIQENIKTDIGIKTLFKLALKFKTWGNEKILSFNLNDSCFDGSPVCDTGGFLYTPERELFWWESVLLSEGSNVKHLSRYDILDIYMNLIFHNQEIFIQKIPITVYNSTKKKFLARSLSDVLKKYGLHVPINWATGNIREKKFQKSIRKAVTPCF